MNAVAKLCQEHLDAALAAGDEQEAERCRRALAACGEKTNVPKFEDDSRARRTLTRREHRAVQTGRRDPGTGLTLSNLSGRGAELDHKMGIVTDAPGPRVEGNRLVLGRTK